MITTPQILILYGSFVVAFSAWFLQKRRVAYKKIVDDSAATLAKELQSKEAYLSEKILCPGPCERELGRAEFFNAPDGIRARFDGKQLDSLCSFCYFQAYGEQPDPARRTFPK